MNTWLLFLLIVILLWLWLLAMLFFLAVALAAIFMPFLIISLPVLFLSTDLQEQIAENTIGLVPKIELPNVGSLLPRHRSAASRVVVVVVKDDDDDGDVKSEASDDTVVLVDRGGIAVPLMRKEGEKREKEVINPHRRNYSEPIPIGRMLPRRHTETDIKRSPPSATKSFDDFMMDRLGASIPTDNPPPFSTRPLHMWSSDEDDDDDATISSSTPRRKKTRPTTLPIAQVTENKIFNRNSEINNNNTASPSSPLDKKSSLRRSQTEGSYGVMKSVSWNINNNKDNNRLKRTAKDTPSKKGKNKKGEGSILSRILTFKL